jgi:Skp1 family protein with oligomerisation domain
LKNRYAARSCPKQFSFFLTVDVM